MEARLLLPRDSGGAMGVEDWRLEGSAGELQGLGWNGGGAGGG